LKKAIFVLVLRSVLLILWGGIYTSFITI
jgi:hypothetical protein